MTISAKLSDVGGLEFVVSDPPDTDDVNGFSDILATVGAETAKFSNSSTMQANTGLIIGLSQVKFVTGAPGRNRSIVAGSDTGTSNAANMINGLLTIPGATRTAVGQYAIIDFSSISTADLKVNYQNQNVAQSHVYKVEIATAASTGPYTDLGNTAVPNGQPNTTKDFGSQMWRYVRVTLVSSTGVPEALNINEVFEDSGGGDTVTVRLRSSTTIDTANGGILISDTVLSESSTTTFDTELLLTGNGEFVTLEIVSFSGLVIDVNLSEITSVKEV